jgi:Protein of unknown function (DUF3078)
MRAFCLLVLFMTGMAAAVQAQTEVKNLKDMEGQALKEEDLGWKKGGDLGLNLNGFGIGNPRLSDGTNQFGFGGFVNLFANVKHANSFWTNAGSLQLQALRNGKRSAVNPFQKNADLIRLLTRYGYNISKNKIFVAVQGDLETQLLPTYSGSRLSGNDSELLSKFFSPLRLNLAPGLLYRPNAKLAFFLAPAGLNFVYVGDDALAALKGQPLGNELGKNNRVQLGYKLNAEYNNKYFKDRVAMMSNFTWFADYRQNMNGFALWTNSATVQIFKGLGLKLVGEMFYDHFSKAVVKEVPVGTTPDKLDPFLGLATTYRGGFFLTYSRIF